MNSAPCPAEQLTIPGHRIDSLIGCGGMGCVYRAHQDSLQRNVALKILRTGKKAGQTECIERFKNEAHTLASLSHPNIVTVFDRGETEHGPYISMELIEGGQTFATGSSPACA